MTKTLKNSVFILIIIVILIIGIIVFKQIQENVAPKTIEFSEKYKPLEDLGNEDTDFNLSNLIKNKYYIVLENDTVFNKSELDNFIEHTNSNIPDQIRIIQVTLEGKIIIKDIIFTGDKFIIKDDNRWSGNIEAENEKITTNEYDVKTYKLVKEDMQNVSNNLVTYYKINLVSNNNSNSIYLCDYVESIDNNEYNFEIEFEEDLTKGRQAILLKSENSKYDYDIYSYNGNVNIIIDGEKLTLRDALLTNKITIEQILEKANKDTDVYKTAYKLGYPDGGSAEYFYENYAILKLNVQGIIENGLVEVYNKDLYIGNIAMDISEIKELYYNDK